MLTFRPKLNEDCNCKKLQRGSRVGAARPKLNKPKDILLNYKIKTKKLRQKNIIFFSIFRDQHDTTKANRKFCISENDSGGYA